MAASDDVATQQLTQDMVDPRRRGMNNSGLSLKDISDVMCILHPCSPAAFNLVMETMRRAPQHVLQNLEHTELEYETSPDLAEEQETFIIKRKNKSTDDQSAMDLALRFSSETVAPAYGFIFGRAIGNCDILVSPGAHKRVSGRHFCIYMNESGVLMLQDMSTNGTMVDHTLLKYRNGTASAPQHMLVNGSIIQILSTEPQEILKFIVRIPQREGYMEEYHANFSLYMQRCAVAQQQAERLPQRALQHATPAHGGSTIKMPLVATPFGMRWSGSPHYNVVGCIGKGAFATVYQLATKSDGTLFAAKELEKRKFMKNGILDRKLDNEMQIMRAIHHDNVVKYVDYQDIGEHLYIIMEFVPHGDLQQYLAGPGHGHGGMPLPEKMAKRMADQIFDALHYLHRQMITHRDIKPDNILIHDNNPETFTVKLSDFGLSKVVKDDETFLKTFCGTLLYCAPEVFPHYNSTAAQRGVKRTRKSAGNQQLNYRSYSQAVDIWSFGAVLWFALCLKPPFEGVADKDGRGMFDRIMSTSLNVADLVDRRISAEAVELLVQMMNTDPMARPSPYECLHHPWLERAVPMAPQPATGLGAIVEEDDHPDLSQLSIMEQGQSMRSEVSLDSSDMDFFASKRFKPEAIDYRDQESMLQSSGEMMMDDRLDDWDSDLDRRNKQPEAKVKAPKLFGEVSASNLLDVPLPKTGDVTQKLTPEEAKSLYGDACGDAQSLYGDYPSSQFPDAQFPSMPLGTESPSLLGAREAVRDLHMDSPFNSRTRPVQPGTDAPSTPAQQAASQASNENPSANLDDTPRPAQPSSDRPFDRHIRLPLTASYFWDPRDKSTHTLEYASKMSGHDFVAEPAFYGDVTMPSTTQNSTANSRNSLEDPSFDSQKSPSSAVLPRFDSPRTGSCYGRLISTPDSFAPLTLEMQHIRNSFGRGPSNTIIYPDVTDTRISKCSMIIYFHAEGQGDLREDEDWTRLPDLYTGIITHASAGIWINGVHLRSQSGATGQQPTGRLHNGDEITICAPYSNGKAGMKFICEFYCGEARRPRERDAPRFTVVEAPTRQRSRSKSKPRDGR